MELEIVKVGDSNCGFGLKSSFVIYFESLKRIHHHDCEDQIVRHVEIGTKVRI